MHTKLLFTTRNSRFFSAEFPADFGVKYSTGNRFAKEL